MRFKASIVECARNSIYKEMGNAPGFHIFKFSRSKIWFTKRQKEKVYYLTLFAVCPFQDGASYTFDKVYDKRDNKKWVIIIAGGKACDATLEMDWFNKIKCNIIHKRYLVQRESWFVKLIIGAIITFLFFVIGKLIFR